MVVLNVAAGPHHEQLQRVLHLCMRTKCKHMRWLLWRLYVLKFYGKKMHVQLWSEVYTYHRPNVSSEAETARDASALRAAQFKELVHVKPTRNIKRKCFRRARCVKGFLTLNILLTFFCLFLGKQSDSDGWQKREKPAVFHSG